LYLNIRYKYLTLPVWPFVEILEEHKHKSLVWRPKSSIELDLFLPGLSLAFELEGEQHYKDTHAAGQFSGTQGAGVEDCCFFPPLTNLCFQACTKTIMQSTRHV
jgi:hypothetical protein